MKQKKLLKKSSSTTIMKKAALARGKELGADELGKGSNENSERLLPKAWGARKRKPRLAAGGSSKGGESILIVKKGRPERARVCEARRERNLDR